MSGTINFFPFVYNVADYFIIAKKNYDEIKAGQIKNNQQEVKDCQQFHFTKWIIIINPDIKKVFQIMLILQQ